MEKDGLFHLSLVPLTPVTLPSTLQEGPQLSSLDAGPARGKLQFRYQKLEGRRQFSSAAPPVDLGPECRVGQWGQGGGHLVPLGTGLPEFVWVSMPALPCP